MLAESEDPDAWGAWLRWVNDPPRQAYSTATATPRRSPRTPQTRQSFAQAQAAAALEDDDE